MIDLSKNEIWFACGSQSLYGEETLKQVEADMRQVAEALSGSSEIPVKIVTSQVLTTPEAIHEFCLKANASPQCVGIIAWMHTFSPAKMWIRGLAALEKPLAHLHTQFYRDLPWSEIDMDYMNLHQSAHGGREFGYICTRMGIRRKVIVGHWEDSAIQRKLGIWSRAASAVADLRRGTVARLGDNMRDVAVTEGDKVEAQIRLGVTVSGYGMGDLVSHIDAVLPSRIDVLLSQYEDEYGIDAELKEGGDKHEKLREAARIELGLHDFMGSGNFIGLTDTFENLHGLKQLPGLAIQRLMAAGYGFGAEGDWKTAAMVRAMKVMADGLNGGTSFMEDYTYHLNPSGMKVLGAHMLEVCPSIAASRPSLEMHPLGIGGKDDPARLVFTAPPGPAVNLGILDLGDRFRLVANEVDLVIPEHPLPKLPVASALWTPRPDLPTAAEAWILAGGPHHTSMSMAITTEYLEDFAEIVGVELLRIDANTQIADFKDRMRLGNTYL